MKKTILLFFIPILGLAQLGTGLEIDDEGYANIPLKARNVGYQGTSFDNDKVSLRQYAPAIKNQGGAGTCVGWATAYYAQTISFARDNEIIDNATISDLAFSPLYLYRSVKLQEDTACERGIGIPTALQTLKETGSVYFKDFPHLCANRIPDSVHSKTQGYKLKEFTKLFHNKESFLSRVRQTRKALAEGKPVVMGMKVKNSFLSAKVVYEPDTIPYGNHAMTVIGYDDNKFGPGEGAFEIINSWGEDWGNDGYMWIRYPDYGKEVYYGFELVFEEIPQVDEIVKNKLSASLELESFGFPIEVAQRSSTVGGLGYRQSTVYNDEGAGVVDYVTKDEYEMKTQYFIRANINQPAYVYVLGADVKHPVSRLFPVNDSISSYVSSGDASVLIPGMNDKNQMGRFELNTNDVQSDYTIAIVSLEELDIQSVKEKVDAMDGPIVDRFYTVLQEKLIAKEDMVLKNDILGFDAEFEEGSAAILSLDIRRSDFQEDKIEDE
ncbi:C1 family peptidase [Croceivirga thetidis]|uniref:C1 family peptidase n=1 Tax=Croceivirga thetidis TaxID=2721623 RepID=A0ABX1GN53_9FLAO|nr:C1 family peptidase [Croceivirga thetidis]NKI30994.1 C1 family peptidase [Croceivirga thetidis]